MGALANRSLESQLYVLRAPQSYAGSQVINGSLQTLAEINVRGAARLLLDIANAGAALSEFRIRGKAHSGNYMVIAHAAGDYTAAPANSLLIGVADNAGAVLDFTTMADTKIGFILMDVQGFDVIELAASCGTSTTLTLQAQVTK